jgi:DNA-binding MarR family transcriptional regulator
MSERPRTSPPERPKRRLLPDEMAAWRGFLRIHAGLMRRLDAELLEEHGLPLSHYDVLLQLAEVGGSLRMSELADAVLLSRSGLTRLVDQLERQSLVARRRASDDARGVEATLTEAGWERLRAAAPTHVRGVRRLFLEPLGSERQAALAEAWEALDRSG